MHTVGEKAKALGKKIADKGGNFIAHRIMLRPNLDIARGKAADKKREALLRRRESIKNDKAMGY